MKCQYEGCQEPADHFTKVYHTRGRIAYYAECIYCYEPPQLEEEVHFETEEEFFTDQLKSKL